MEPSFRQDIYQGLQQAVRQGSEGVSALDLGEAGSVNKGPVLVAEVKEQGIDDLGE